MAARATRELVTPTMDDNPADDDLDVPVRRRANGTVIPPDDVATDSPDDDSPDDDSSDDDSLDVTIREERRNRFTMVALPERAGYELYNDYQVQYDKLGAIVSDDDCVVAGGRWLFVDEFIGHWVRPIAKCMPWRGPDRRAYSVFGRDVLDDPENLFRDDDMLMIESAHGRGSAFKHRIKVLQRIFRRQYVRRALHACHVFTRLAEDIVNNMVDFAVGPYPYVRR